VLRRWDAARSDAWARGDVWALRQLYVPGSASGRSDARMLGEYVSRGLVVRGLRTQVLALSVASAGERRLVLRVTDRVVGGVAVSRRGPAVALPVDRPSVRRVELRRSAGKWRVVEVRDVLPVAS
jgi:hypothetical protein